MCKAKSWDYAGLLAGRARSWALAVEPRVPRGGVGPLFLTHLAVGSGASQILCRHSDGQGQDPAESMAGAGLLVFRLGLQAAGL